MIDGSFYTVQHINRKEHIMHFEKILIWMAAFASLTVMSFAQAVWVGQTNPLADSSLGKIQFVNSTEGWISEAHGKLLHTTNAGTNWTVVTPFPGDTVSSMTDPANSMWWADQAHGWKINWPGTGFGDAHGAVIHKTTDGGSTWEKIVISTASGDMGFQVQFVDDYNGWASIYNPAGSTFNTLRSTDGGNNWHPVGTGGIFYFVDTSNGWAIGTPKIYHTTNGGINWSPQYTDAAIGTGGFNAIQFTDLNHGWVVGDSGRILKTTDGGIHWTPMNNTGISSNFRSKGLFFLDANTGWIGSKIVNMPFSGDVGINLYTNNGGSTWTTQSFPGAYNSDNVWSIFFTDADHGWYTSDDGIIGHTTNGSATGVGAAAAHQTPRVFSLQQNYPDPFNPTTTIQFSIEKDGRAVVKVFDILGHRIATLYDNAAEAGKIYRVTMDGSKFASGVYFYTIESNDQRIAKKMMLLK